MSSSVISWTRGCSSAIRRGTKALLTSLRSRVCSGASAVIMLRMRTGLLSSRRSRNQAGEFSTCLDRRGSLNPLSAVS